MEFEDSKNAMYCDPNAYILNNEFKSSKKKIVFSEPYECLPNFYINNNFKKKNCDCVKNHKHNFCNCNKDNICHDNINHKDCEKPKNTPMNNMNFGFNLSNFLPILGSLGKGGDIGGISKILSNFAKNGKEEGVMNFLNNPSILNSVMSLFKLGKSKTESHKKEIEPTEFEIKDYTRVD